MKPEELFVWIVILISCSIIWYFFIKLIFKLF